MPTVNGAHQDGVNQNYSIIGVIGTQGTADVGGTAETLPIGVNPANGAMYVSGISLPPTAQTNPSLVISYNASNQPITLAKTISGTVYTKTLTWTGDVCTAVSSWS